jgi:8-oxo-dGTP diphosphatase
MTKYVIGFVFDFPKQQVMLIKKNRPTDQAGVLNGIGGKVEGVLEDKDPVLAMVREAKEEADFDSVSASWLLFHNELHQSGKDLYFYTTSTTRLSDQVRSMTDEKVVLAGYEVKSRCGRFDGVNFDLSQTMYNLGWLLPMAHCYLWYPQHRYVRG